MELNSSISDFNWLDLVLGVDEEASREQYLCQPNSTDPTFLLPIDSAPATAKALDRFSDEKTRKETLKTLAARSLARASGLKVKPSLAGVGSPVDLSKWELVTELEKQLGEPKLHVAVTLGGRRRNRKPVLQLITPAGEAVGFAKVGWSKLTDELVSNESEILTKLRGKLPNTIEAPRVLLDFEWKGHKVIVISPVNASPFANRTSAVASPIFAAIAGALDIKDAAFADVPLLADSPLAPISDYIDIDRLKSRYEDATLKLGTWHGDLTPWNTSTVRGKTAIWDWEFGAIEVPIGLDQLHCTFELLRRDPKITSTEALTGVHARADELLDPFKQPVEATFSLYLLELMKRELMLEGQLWDNKEMNLLPHLIDFFREDGLVKE